MNNEQPQDTSERELLRRFSRAAEQAAGPCPSEMDLAAYVDGLAAEAERERIEAHLALCPSCLDGAVQARQLAVAAMGEAPEAVAARERALVPAHRALGRLRRWRQAAGWAAAAAAVVAVGLAGLRAGSATRERGQTGAWVAAEVTFQPPAPYRGLLSSDDVLSNLAAQAGEGRDE